MYNNLIFFLLVLLVFMTYQPGAEPPMAWWAVALINVLIPAALWAAARARFSDLIRRLDGGVGPPAALYYHALTRLSILALAGYASAVYFFGFKDLIAAAPGIGKSTALTGLLGLAGFGVYMSMVWSEASRVHTRIFRSVLTRRRYVVGQLRFNLPIIVPYLILTLAVDLTGLLPESPVKAWLDSPVGDLVFVELVITLLTVVFPALIRPIWKLESLPPGPERTVIEDFCRKHGLTYRDIMLWPLYEGEGLTAGVMGLFRPWRYILVTRSLLGVLDRDELEAVLGHEIGHVKRRHLLWYLFFLQVYILLAYAMYFATIIALRFTSLGRGLMAAVGDEQGTGMALLVNAPVVLTIILYFRFVLGAFMRNFERQADLYGYRLTGGIHGLVSSLEKIARFSGQSRSLPSWHHFSVARRVEFLFEAVRRPGSIARHERKVRLMLAGFLLGTVLFIGGGAAVFLDPGGHLTRRMAVSSLEDMVGREPGHVNAYAALGELYYQAGRFERAEAAWSAALALSPDDPVLVNNLAWVLVTKPDPGPDDRIRGLELAQRAAAAQPASFILDTLAEAYWVNRRTRDALETIEKAIEAAGPKDDLDYLRGQRKKYESALE